MLLASTIFCSSLFIKSPKSKLTTCNATCQYNLFLSQTKSEDTPQSILARTARNKHVLSVRPLICSIIVPTELTSPPQAKRGTKVIYLDINVLSNSLNIFAHLHNFYLLLYSFPASQQNSVFQPSPVSLQVLLHASCGKCHTTPLLKYSPQPNNTST